MAPEIKDAFKIGSKCCIASDCDLRGNITIGSGSILHPRCTILAMSGPIVIGSGCIVEENVVLLNRARTPMTIGDNNHFQVGCRVESPSVGSNNTFGVRCRVSHAVSVGSDSSISAGCVVLPSPFAPPALPASLQPPRSSEADCGSTSAMSVDALPPPPPTEPEEELLQATETLPDFTVVFGGENRRRTWTSEGIGQRRALHIKHLVYLSETLPKFHRLKTFT